MFDFLCPACGAPLGANQDGATLTCGSGHRYPFRSGVVDLTSGNVDDEATADHYTKQWGAALGIGEFLKSDAKAAAITPGKQLGWPDLFRRIREQAQRSATRVYDAACGFGGICTELFSDPAPPHLGYVGADIHRSLAEIARPEGLPPERIRFVRWDISAPLPTTARFDYVICRAAIHHTADPRRTFGSLVARLADGGTIAISAYARKAPMREAIDDLFRGAIREMAPEDALRAARQFTELGKALQACAGSITIERDLPLLGIKQGKYAVQEFVYDHFIKCWFNPAFGHRYSDVVNYDWYHPTYAFRYDLEELVGWFDAHALKVVRTSSIKAQHYVEGIAN